MKNNGYIPKNENILLNNKNKETRGKKIKHKTKKNLKRRKAATINIKKIKEIIKLDSPPKKVKIVKKEKNRTLISSNEIKDITDNKGDSLNKMNPSEREILDHINKKSKKNKKKIKLKIIKKNKKDFFQQEKLSKRTKAEILYRKKEKIVFGIPTQGALEGSYIVPNISKEVALPLPQEIIDRASSFELPNIYSFEEAIKYDLRSLCKIFYIYLLTKQVIFHTFLYKSPLELFSLRLCLLFFIISNDLALNAIFYFDNKISEKYRYEKNIFLFAVSKNTTIILISTFIGFVFLTLFTKLSNSSNDLRDVFRKEEDKMKRNKKYEVSEERKWQIKNEIEKILKKYKIKVFILIILDLLLMILFFYYTTVFCHVYQNTQLSWLVDSLLTMVYRITIDMLLCLFFSKIYRIAVESNTNCLYKISLFFYSFC